MKIFAPTPGTYPSAAVNIGHIVFNDAYLKQIRFIPLRQGGETNSNSYYNKFDQGTMAFDGCTIDRNYAIIRKEKQLDYFSQVVSAANSGKPIPTEPKWNKWIHRNEGKTHCDVCLKLHECWFSKELTPKWPHHPYCHCVLENIPYVNVMYNASADCPYAKFDPYLFDPANFYKHGKSRMLESWGYSVSDSKWLQSEIQKQGMEKYINGNYVLNKLDDEGQRINIRVEIPRKDKPGTVSFITGWMVDPNGRIRLVTPYGDN